MPTEHRLHLVEDRHDSLDLAARTSALADLAHGRAVCHPTPGIRRHDQLAADLLACLGKRFDALRFERTRKRASHLVDVWLGAERIRHLFVLRAHLLAAPLLRALPELVRPCGAEVWFVVGPSPGRWPLSEHVPLRRWSPAQFLARWAGTPAPDEGVESAAGPFPEVPADDFLTFRAACRQFLGPEDFDAVDGRFCASMDQTATWLKARTGPRSRSLHITVEAAEVAVQIQGLLSGASCTSEALTCLRGAQAAYFLAGWLVEFSPQLVDPASGLVPLGPPLDRGTAARLRRLCTPRSTAAMTLRFAADLRGEGLARLNINDIDEDGGGVAIGGQRFSIPPYARSLVRAQLVDRLRGGGSGAEPLFVHAETGDRQAPSGLRNVLRSASYRTALSVGVHDSMISARDPEHWLRTRGIRMTPLDPIPALLS